MKKLSITLFFLPLFSFGQIISQYVETNKGSSPKGIEIYNNTGATLDFGNTNLTVWQHTNGDSDGDELKVTVNSGTLLPNEVMVIGSSAMQTDVNANNPNCLFISYGFAFNVNDTLTIKLDGTTTDTFGRAPTGWDSETNGTAYYRVITLLKALIKILKENWEFLLVT